VVGNLEPVTDSQHYTMTLSSSREAEHMNYVRNKKKTVEDEDYNLARCNPIAASLQLDWRYCEGVS
jgi:hypothetical protein